LCIVREGEHMAAPSLQDVLSAVPAARIDEMNEIIPGVQADKKTLSAVLKEVGNKRGVVLFNGSDSPIITLHTMERKKPRLEIELQTALIKAPEGYCYRQSITREEFPKNEDGLLQAICWGKKMLKRVRDEGTCPDCLPRRRMKVEGTPKCCEHLLKEAVGL
jgi:hypothetical protein